MKSEIEAVAVQDLCRGTCANFLQWALERHIIRQ